MMENQYVRTVPILLGVLGIQAPPVPASLLAITSKFGNLAIAPKSTVYANIGNDASIFCSVPPISLPAISQDQENICRFYHIADDGLRSILVNATESNVSVQIGNGNYSYFGKGVNQGECGLKILDVSNDHFGTWVCSLVSTNLWLTNISLLEYEKPQKPAIITDDFQSGINVTDYQNGTETEALKIRCCTIGGKPIEETKLAFNLNGKELDGLILIKHENDSTSTSTCVQTERKFVAEENGKYLICKVTHPALINFPDNAEQVHEALLVNVNYPPKILFQNGPDFVTKRIYTDDGKIELYFNGKGNPIPDVTVEVADLKTGGKSIEKKVQITTNTVGNLHQFMMKVDAPNENDGNVRYEITLRNGLGSDFGVSVVSPPPGDNTTMWILIAIGAVMSLIFVGIILYFLNSSVQRRGWFCYTKRVGAYPVKKSDGRVQQEYSSVTGVENSEF